MIMFTLLSGVAMAGQVEGCQGMERFGEAGISELVPHAPAFCRRGDQTAPAKTGQVVREVGSGRPEALREFGRISRSVDEVDQDAPAGRVRERGSDPTESREIECEVRYSHG